MEPTSPPQAPARSFTRPSPTHLMLVIVILAIVAAVLGAALLTRDSGGADGRAGELFLEPADANGPEPFMPSVAAGSKAPAATSTTTASRPAGDGIRSVAGAQVGLYGGTMDVASCDPEKLVTFLEQHPDLATAWAAVQGLRPEGIREYVDGLTPVVLRSDTRVTNHGFADGRATPRQSVLQAGTAVLVDEYGVPRVRCFCGNPLRAPRPLAAPVEVGAPWPGYSVVNVIVVVARVEVETFVLVDPVGTRFGRPAGTDGDADVPYLADGDAGPGETAPSPSPSPVPEDAGPATPTGVYAVSFSGQAVTPPCVPWGSGTGSMDVAVEGGTIAITLHGIGGSVTDYAGTYDAATGAFSAPTVQYDNHPLTGTFVAGDGLFTVPDGRANAQGVSGGPCVGAFTAVQDVG